MSIPGLPAQGSTDWYAYAQGLDIEARKIGTVDAIPAGSTLTVQKSGGTWPARPTSRTDVTVAWKGPDPSPPPVSSGTGGMLDNVDYRLVTP